MKNESKYERSAEEILKDFIRKETEYLQSCNPTNELGEITGNDFAAGVVRGMNKVLEEYASQFKRSIDDLKNQIAQLKKENKFFLSIERHLVKIKNTQLELKQKEIDRLKDDLFTVADPDHPDYKSIKERYNT